MLEIVSESGNWQIKMNDMVYEFYYSNAIPILGLCLNGYSGKEDEYIIGKYKFSAIKERCIYFESGYGYLLRIEVV